MNSPEWPEDEAALTASTYKETCADYPDTPAENLKELRGNVAHMLKVFDRVAETPEQAASDKARYLESLNARLPGVALVAN